MDMITGWFLQWRKGAARMSRHPGVGELVMEALSTVDPVAYIRIALVYRDFPRGQSILASSSRGLWRMTIKGGYGWSRLL